jgi:hypothetical protein
MTEAGWSGTSLYDTFLQSLDDARVLMASAAVADHWNDASALEGMTVGGLVAHLTMATKALVGVVEGRELSSPELAAAAGGVEVHRRAEDFVASTRFDDPTDVQGDMARWVQSKAASDAARGRDVVLERYDRGVAAIGSVLPGTPTHQIVKVPVNVLMSMEDYVATRLVEVVVHGDDLAASVGDDPAPFGPDATGFVLELLIASMRRRSGDAALVRALARSERAAPGVLRAL